MLHLSFATLLSVACLLSLVTTDLLQPVPCPPRSASRFAETESTRTSAPSMPARYVRSQGAGLVETHGIRQTTSPSINPLETRFYKTSTRRFRDKLLGNSSGFVWKGWLHSRVLLPSPLTTRAYSTYSAPWVPCRRFYKCYGRGITWLFLRLPTIGARYISRKLFSRNKWPVVGAVRKHL